MTTRLNKDDSEMVKTLMWKSIMGLIGKADEIGYDKTVKTFLTQLDEK